MPVLFIAATLSSLIACDESDSKDASDLPPITMEGNNTFGCMLDGKVWIPISNFSEGGIYTELQTVTDTIGINIYADNAKDENGFTLSVYDSPAIKTGKVYDLTNPNFFVQYSWQNEEIVCLYEETESGSIIFTRFDLTNRIVAGTFEFNAHSLECSESVVVTEGRFDLTF